ncbi:hypothetical protein F2Q70_00033001 [Brassica cretica]|uniref:Uncharacterized protein n=1 Tax=Brassica cretica TaxID=69181 RepID=A0A8S9FG79_BRACR|nr:hypothetical protein F2Q70_00033001 [Brassica cretica]
MVLSSPPWSPVSSSHRLAPSSPSRARSIVTVSSSLRRQRSPARSVTTTLEDSEKVEPEEEGGGGLRQFTTVRR